MKGKKRTGAKKRGGAKGRKAAAQTGRRGPRPTARGAARPARRGAPSARRDKVLRARDLMTRGPIVVPESMKVGALCDLLQERNINGAPVVDDKGRLVGVVTQEDIIYGAMGHPTVEETGPTAVPDPVPAPGAAAAASAGEAPMRRRGARPSRRVVAMLRGRHLQEAPPAPLERGEKPFWAEQRSPDPMEMPVSTIMTSPAISAEEDTRVIDLCQIMWSLKIHRVPILNKEKVTGLVSSMDLCRAVIEGKVRL